MEYKNQIAEFQKYLISEEKSNATISKYIHDVTAFSEWLNDTELTKDAVLEYKKYLKNQYLPASVNSKLSSVNSFLSYINRDDCRVKSIKIQKRPFAIPQRELSKSEYKRLLAAAWKLKKIRLYYIIQTICATGIRVSELKYITVEALRAGTATVKCKNKLRVIIIPKKLCKMLLNYAKQIKIKSGPIFVTKSGKPIDRSNIWSEMKKLCILANVDKSKVFPHNLRHLFAKTHYSTHKDIVRLADILGHTSVNTTRIYTSESGEVHKRQIQKLDLIIENTT